MPDNEDTVSPSEEEAVGVLVGCVADHDGELSEDVHIGHRVQPKLFDDDNGFTDEFQHIIDHRQGEILRLLQNQWPKIEEHVSNHPSVREGIANIRVPLPYYSGTKRWQLHQTYLPLPKLKDRFSQYAEDTENEYFPFLDFQDTLAPDDLSAWTFLHVFGVGNDDNLQFYLDVLSVIKGDSTPYPKVFELYHIIHKKVTSSGDDVIARELVRSYFEKFRLIAVPIEGEWDWQNAKECRWDAPKHTWFTGLEAAYLPFFGENATWADTLAPFMRETVGVEDLSSSEIVIATRMEKMLLQSSEACNRHVGIEKDGSEKEILGTLYYRLADMKADLTPEDQTELQKSFSTEELIYTAKGWHTTDDCLWSSTVDMPGKATLNTDWPIMKTLFTDVLGVPELEEEIVDQQDPDRHAGARKRKRQTAIPPESNSASSVGDLGVPNRYEYLQLLDAVINAARATNLQQMGHFDISVKGAAFGGLGGTGKGKGKGKGKGNGDHFKLLSVGAERNMMIGAAGELYVFELLSKGLPSFTQANWKSTIRKYVTVHPKYADMGRWKGTETADFEYCDRNSALTTLLIERGYLDKEKWDGRNPKYYIEVKATMGARGAKFCMSESQYNKMGDKNDIYVICRVFHLGRQSIGCAIYVDPESMRLQGALKFAGKYMVGPGRRA